MRLESEMGSVRHSGTQRLSVLKRDIANGFELAMNGRSGGALGALSEKKEEPRKSALAQKDYSRQQREVQRRVHGEKQKAMKDLELERKRMGILQRQLRAEHERLKSKQAMDRNGRWKGRTARMSHKGYVDTKVKKIYLQPTKRKVANRKGDVVNYRPKEVRIVYRDLKKKVVLRTTEWNTRIKYLNGKGKELEILKRKILILEDKIDRKKHKKKKKKKKNGKK